MALAEQTIFVWAKKQRAPCQEFLSRTVIEQIMTNEQIDEIAQTVYAASGWDRPWNDIDESGRERWREMVRMVLNLAAQR